MKSEEKQPRFAFEYPGSVQGFSICPYVEHIKCVPLISNGNQVGAGNGLRVTFDTLAEGANANISVATFLDIHEEYRNYETYVSPTLYTGQEVTICLDCPKKNGPKVRPYIWYADRESRLKRMCGEWVQALPQGVVLTWNIPDNGGLPILRFGLEFASVSRYQGDVFVRSIDWSNTPVRLEQKGIMMRDMWDTDPFWAKMFVSSAKHFSPNLNCTYCISHDEPGGVATIGTRDFKDYTVSSVLKFSLHKRGGLVARSVGHRRYYAAAVSGGDTFQIIKRKDSEEKVLAEIRISYMQFEKYPMWFSVCGNKLQAGFDNIVLIAEDKEDA